MSGPSPPSPDCPRRCPRLCRLPLCIFDDFSVDKFLVGEFDVGVVIVVVVVDDVVVVVVVIVVVENDANDEGLETLKDI